MKTAILTWPEGRHKVVTFSYDDGKAADRRLVALFNDHGLKGTFHLNAGLLGEGERLGADEVRRLYAGHEIAAHTWNHPTIARCPLDQVALQVLEDRRGLEPLAGRPVSGFSYPNGSVDPAIVRLLPDLGVRYARMVGNSHSFALPDDPWRWVSTCHHNQGLADRTTEFLAHAKSQYLIWFSVWGHSYEFDRDNNWAVIEDACQRLGDDPGVWSATCLEAFDYLEAGRRVRFSTDLSQAENPNAIALWFTIDGQLVKLVPGSNSAAMSSWWAKNDTSPRST